MPKKPVQIHSDLLDQVVKEARASERRRMNFNFHQLEDPANRMLNAIEPESYIRPHRHLEPPRDEAFFVLRGKGVVALFKDDGSVEHVCRLDLETENFGTDIPAGWYHTIVSLQSGSVFYEVKAGPYEPAKAKEFASWAPGDNTPEAAVYLEQLKKIISEFD